MSATVKIPTSAHELLARATTSCVSATPDKNGHVPPGSCDAYYPFYPSFAAAAACTALFLIETLAHIYQAFLHKRPFCLVIIMGALWEFISFALRAASAKNQQNLYLVSNSFMFFALAPLWINAFVYMAAGRLIFCFLPSKRVFGINAISIGKIFVIADILSFLIQLGGAYMISPGVSEKLQSTGLHLYQAGIGIQQAVIIVFMVIIVVFHKKMTDMERTGWSDSLGRPWKLMLWVMYAVLALITVRIVYRLAEYIIGLDDSNPLPHNEIYMYVLDALPMFIALMLLNIFHPGRVLIGPGSEYKAGKKEFKAQRKAAKRGLNGAESPESSAGEEERMVGLEMLGQGPNVHMYAPLNEAAPLQGRNHSAYQPYRGHM